jgi:transposase
MSGIEEIGKAGRAAIYTAYNLGGSVFVGLARTAIAIAHIAKHTFYAKKYEVFKTMKQLERTAQHAMSEADRKAENAKATEKTKKATGPKKGLAFFGEKATKLANKVDSVLEKVDMKLENALDAVPAKAIEKLTSMSRKDWYGQLARGLGEMVPVFGAAYYTYKDNFGKKPTVLGLGELEELLKNEHNRDETIIGFVGKELYNPLF